MPTLDTLFSELEQIKADYVCVHFHKQDNALVFITSIQNDEDIFDSDENPSSLQTGLEQLVSNLVSPIIDSISQGNYKFDYKSKKVTSTFEF